MLKEPGPGHTSARSGVSEEDIWQRKAQPGIQSRRQGCDKPKESWFAQGWERKGQQALSKVWGTLQNHEESKCSSLSTIEHLEKYQESPEEFWKQPQLKMNSSTLHPHCLSNGLRWTFVRPCHFQQTQWTICRKSIRVCWTWLDSVASPGKVQWKSTQTT